jgi:hypothetical protein
VPFQTASQVANAVRFSGARRTVKQQSLLSREAQRPKGRSPFAEFQDIPLYDAERFLWEDQVFATHWIEIMDLDPLCMTRPGVAVFKGQDASPVTTLSRKLSLEAFEQLRGERYPLLPRCCGELERYALSPTVVVGLRDDNRIRFGTVCQYPQAILQAPDSLSPSNIDLLVLGWCYLYRVSPLFHEPRVADRLMPISWLKAEEVIGNAPLSEKLIERSL